MNRRNFLKTTLLSSGLTIYLDQAQDTFIVKCPQCSKRGLKSKSYQLSCATTLQNPLIWFDEDGAMHVNDPNKITCQYECSNGHRFEL